MIALGAHDDKPDYDYGDGVELRVYALKDGVSAETVVYGLDQSAKVKACALKSGDKITIDVESKSPCKVRLVNVKAQSCTGATYSVDGNDTVLTDVSGHVECTL